MAKKKINEKLNAAKVSAGGSGGGQFNGDKPGKNEPSLNGGSSLLSKAGNKVHLFIAASIALVTWLFLKATLNNQFTNWDDNGYVGTNPLVKDLSASGLAHMFSTSTSVMGNYHPLTILSYAIEYSKVGLEPFLYHADSLVLHVINTMLVYWFINLLTRKPVAAIITAVLFGLHPMHVESVAWIAGRKDVVYSLFYLLCCIAHIYFIRAAGSKKWGWYLAGILLFVCSLMGKPVAVVLPLSLLLIDYFLDREPGNALPVLRSVSKNRLVGWMTEKMPHFAIALIFGVISVRSQHDFHALFRSTINYGFIGRILLGCYALVTYLWKVVAPVNLSCFYPYPSRVDGALPSVFYIYPVITIGLVYAGWYFRRNKLVVFGVLFFLANIILLLQFIPVGGAIFAERYSYIPYIGLFFIVGMVIAGLWESRRQFSYAVLGGLGIYALCLGMMSSDRCKVWHDSGSLWGDQIEKYPFRTANSYDNLALYYYNRFSAATDMSEKKLCYDSASYLLNTAIHIESDFPNPYVGLAVLQNDAGQMAESKKNFLKVLTFDDKNFCLLAYQKLAIIYAMDNKFDSAVYCFDAALKINNNGSDVHTNYGKVLRLSGNPDAAMKELGIAIAQDPGYFAPYLERGVLYLQTNKLPEALADLNNAIKLNERSGEAYYYRALYYTQTGNAAAAQQDGAKAKSLGYGGN